MLFGQLDYVARVNTTFSRVVLTPFDAQDVLEFDFRLHEATQQTDCFGSMVILRFPQFAEARHYICVHGLTTEQGVY